MTGNNHYDIMDGIVFWQGGSEGSLLAGEPGGLFGLIFACGGGIGEVAGGGAGHMEYLDK
jgi:hypothetical protein